MFPIRLENVRYRPNGRNVLDDVNLAIGGDGISVVLGPNGAGKTVLLRMLAGLLRPDGGRIVWGDAAMPAAGVAMVFQKPMLLRSSVEVNVALGLKPLGLDRAERRRRTEEALHRVGLADRAEDSARLLSGGEQQRLALARAWITQPRLLLLDEPTAALDPSATDAVESIIREIRTDGTRIVMTTHNLGQAMRISDEVVFIAAGRIRENTPTARFFTSPKSAEAKMFIEGELPWRIAFDV